MTDERFETRRALREALRNALGDAEDRNRIGAAAQADYVRRLKRRYRKNGADKCFYDQFEAGQGHELAGHFWAPASSSRFAFEAFSWLADQPFCEDIEFEYALPKLRDGLGRENDSIRPPTVDVFFRTASEYVFIESKFLEFGPVREAFRALPASYFTERRPGLLRARYHGNGRVSDGFARLVRHVRAYLVEMKADVYDWFDPKQQITHLAGIALWLNENPDVLAELRAGRKRLRFFSVACRLDEPGDEEAEAFRRFFLKTAQEAFWDMFGIGLEYETRCTQDCVRELLAAADGKLKTKAFASDDTVLRRLARFARP